MATRIDTPIKPRRRLQSVVIVMLALLLFTPFLYLFRVPFGIAFIMGLNQFCPCIASTCPDCACDACVNRVLAVAASLLVGVPLFFYLFVHRRRRRG
jgi:hypothetical protein